MGVGSLSNYTFFELTTSHTTVAGLTFCLRLRRVASAVSGGWCPISGTARLERRRGVVHSSSLSEDAPRFRGSLMFRGMTTGTAFGRFSYSLIEGRWIKKKVGETWLQKTTKILKKKSRKYYRQIN